MAAIVAVVTDLARVRWPQMFGGILPFRAITSYKIGEGGWIDPGPGRIARTPDPTLTDLDVIVDLARPPLSKRYVVPGETFAWYSKLLVGADFVYEPPSIIRVNCILDTTEFNDDGSGHNPECWEIGLFDADGVMVAYGTFPKETKAGQIIENDVRIIF